MKTFGYCQTSRDILCSRDTTCPSGPKRCLLTPPFFFGAKNDQNQTFVGISIAWKMHSQILKIVQNNAETYQSSRCEGKSTKCQCTILGTSCESTSRVGRWKLRNNSWAFMRTCRDASSEIQIAPLENGSLRWTHGGWRYLCKSPSGVGVRSTQKAQVYGQKASTRQDDKRAFFKLSYAAWEAIFEVNRMVTQELHC